MRLSKNSAQRRSAIAWLLVTGAMALGNLHFCMAAEPPPAPVTLSWPQTPNLTTPTLGFAPAPEAAFSKIFIADGDTPADQGAYNHHPHLAFHGGKLWAIWSNHLRDEDAAGQRVYLRFSSDLGVTWVPRLTDKPLEVFPALDRWKFKTDKALESDRTGTANGFAVVGEALYAINEVLPNLEMQSQGKGRLARSIDLDGKFGDIFWLREHRPASAVDFPVYPDMSDASVRPKALAVKAVLESPTRRNLPTWDFDGKGNTSTELREPPAAPADGHRLCEPTYSYKLADGTLVVLWRDLSRSFKLYMNFSRDGGTTWSRPVRTAFPDAGSRSSAGNLPDGTAYIFNNPLGIQSPAARQTLTLSLAADGLTFNRTYVIRGADTRPRFEGRAKSSGFAYPHSCLGGGYLFVIYSINKEDIEVCRIPLAGLAAKSLSR